MFRSKWSSSVGLYEYIPFLLDCLTPIMIHKMMQVIKVRIEVLTIVTMMSSVFIDVMPCSLHFIPKCWYLSTKLYCVTFHKAIMFIISQSFLLSTFVSYWEHSWLWQRATKSSGKKIESVQTKRGIVSENKWIHICKGVLNAHSARSDFQLCGKTGEWGI
jgi:hypothetical protein